MKFLNSNEIKKELTDYIEEPFFEEWYDIVKEFLLNKEFQKRKLFKHHTASVWDHCIEVSFKSFKYANKFSADKKVCAIAGLLHDFYPYAWQYSKELEEYDSKYLDRLSKKEKLFEMHGFTHAKEACDNYLKYFKEYENERISNAILRHMFPLNITPPKYKEGWIVTLADKSASIRDTFHIIYAIFKKGN